MRIARTVLASVLTSGLAMVVAVGVAGSANAASGLPSPTPPSVTLTVPTLSVPTLTTPSLPTLTTPTLTAPVLPTGPTQLTVPTLTVPTLSVPTLTAPVLPTGPSQLTVPTLSVPTLTMPTLTMPTLGAITLPALPALPTMGVPSVPGPVAAAAAAGLGLPTVFVLPTLTSAGGAMAAGTDVPAVNVSVRLARKVAKSAIVPVNVGAAYSITATGIKAGTVKVLAKVGSAWVEIGKATAKSKSVTLPTFVAPSAGQYVLKIAGKSTGYVRVNAA